ncbi:MAG: hypothetical protein GF307_09595 [candidate division Zixibacteria bacterium]|nr:hypothetical protein [candidate division Zixibacteria bacterium]
MALRINHNVTALDAWRNLTLTTGSMQNSMEKLSSGYRINKAADDPAGLVISEQFRAQIAGLNRAIQNSEGSINMIQTAEGALTEINSLLVSMRELAIHAANEGLNDENQLLADQSEISNSIKTINRIAANTQFGTKMLLDGSADNVSTITTGNTSGLNLKESGLSDGVHSISATKVTDPSATFNTTSLGIKSPEYVNKMAGGIHNVDVVQASDGATKTTNAIQIRDAWNNGLRLLDGAATVAKITGTMAAAANSLGDTATVSFQLNYQESIDGPVGVQTLTFNITAPATNMSATMSARVITEGLNSAISNNTELAGKVIASVAATGQMAIKSVDSGAQYSVMAAAMNTSGNITFNWSAQSIIGDSGRGASADDTLTVNALVATAGGGDNTYAAQALDLVSAATTIVNEAQLLKIVATQMRQTFGTVHGDSTASGANALARISVATTTTAEGHTALVFKTRDEGSHFYLGFNESSSASSRTSLAFGIDPDGVNITGQDALVSVDGYINTIDEVRYYENSTSDLVTYTLYDGSDTSTRGSFQITVENGKTYGGINVGNILMDVEAATFSVRLDGGPEYNVTAGEWTTLFNASGEESIKVKYDLDSQGGTERIRNTDQSLVFQIGANVGQTSKIGILNMNASYLGQNVTGNQFNSLADIDVTSAEKASDAQAVIDAAIDEVTNLRGNLGSFQRNTLESNLTNLRIASQNLTAAEATIRDTDMALEMSNFVRNQILLQAGTSMLAQANQVPQVVLSLFR